MPGMVMERRGRGRRGRKDRRQIDDSSAANGTQTEPWMGTGRSRGRRADGRRRQGQPGAPGLPQPWPCPAPPHAHARSLRPRCRGKMPDLAECQAAPLPASIAASANNVHRSLSHRIFDPPIRCPPAPDDLPPCVVPSALPSIQPIAPSHAPAFFPTYQRPAVGAPPSSPPSLAHARGPWDYIHDIISPCPCTIPSASRHVSHVLPLITFSHPPATGQQRPHAAVVAMSTSPRIALSQLTPCSLTPEPPSAFSSTYGTVSVRSADPAGGLNLPQTGAQTRTRT